ncbi:MAG: hypothetical protein ACYSWZ_02930 [Planctomycetota bacterium]
MKLVWKRLIKRIIFLVLFTPIHLLATTLMVQKFFYNPSRDPGAMETVFKYLTFVFILPVVYPCMRIDPDGERLPRWFQYFSGFLNSFVWALLLLLLFIIVRRLCTRGPKAGVFL